MNRIHTPGTVILHWILIFTATELHAQHDTVFGFAAPEVSVSNQNSDRPEAASLRGEPPYKMGSSIFRGVS